jgi:hypothetical protein
MSAFAGCGQRLASRTGPPWPARLGIKSPAEAGQGLSTKVKRQCGCFEVTSILVLLPLEHELPSDFDRLITLRGNRFAVR